MERIRILLVDDDRQNSELLRKFLEVEDYEVDYAENGRAGWEMYAANRPDLVLLDINMPEMNGFELLVLLDINMPEMNGFELARKIREQDRDVLIFFLTDRTEKADRLKGFDLKGNDYIPKPFYPEELIAKIKERFVHRQSTLPSRITIGKTIFNSNLSTIEIDGVVQHLSARQSEILTILAQNIGQTVERETILQLCQFPRPQCANHLSPQDARSRHFHLHRVTKETRVYLGGEYRIRPCAVSWASPKRPSVPNDTEFSRMGGSRGETSIAIAPCSPIC